MIKKTITYITSIIPSPLPGKLFTILPESFQFFSPVHSCILTVTLREKCPNTDVFLVHKVTIKNENFFVLIVSCLSTHQGKNFTLKEVFLVRIFPYSVQIQDGPQRPPYLVTFHAVSVYSIPKRRKRPLMHSIRNFSDKLKKCCSKCFI